MKELEPYPEDVEVEPPWEEVEVEPPMEELNVEVKEVQVESSRGSSSLVVKVNREETQQQRQGKPRRSRPTTTPWPNATVPYVIQGSDSASKFSILALLIYPLH